MSIFDSAALQGPVSDRDPERRVAGTRESIATRWLLFVTVEVDMLLPEQRAAVLSDGRWECGA
jgi:hypothetical protein